MAASLCETCNPARYDDPEWFNVHRAIEEYSVDKHVFRHTNGGSVYRKGWEWTHCAYGLQKLGALAPSNRGLGVGAGHECLIFYFADQCSHVIASDLYGNEQWSATGGKEASTELLADPQKFCPRRVDFERIQFVNSSGTSLKFQNDSFDFCWSMSSIEHFGGHNAARLAMREMARVVKPGGIIAVATEYLLLPEYQHPEYFNQAEIIEYLVRASFDLELVSEIDWDTLTREYLIDSICVPEGVHRIRRHVVLNDGQVQWTSVLLFFRKLPQRR